MSHGAVAIRRSDIPAIVSTRLGGLSGTTKGLLLALLAIGAIALVHGASSESYAYTTWIAFHTNAVFWLCLAAASAGFSAVFHICNAQWARPIRRLFESGAPYLAVAWVPFVVTYLFGVDHIFGWARPGWSHHPAPGKEFWLSRNFLFARDILAMWLLAWTIWRVIRLSIARDIGAITKGLTEAPKEVAGQWQNSPVATIVSDWKGDGEAEVKRATDRMGFLSPLVVICYSLVMSLIAFDQIMSIDPHWFSTLFGAFVFMSGVYLAVAWVALNLAFYRELSPIIRAKVTRKTLWDLGKLMFGFGIFWCYLFWSHYLTIWYGNLPEETGWLIVRLREQPWQSLSWGVLGMCWIFPFFFGLSRDVKQVPELLAAAAVVVITGLWFMFFLLIAPTTSPDEIPLGIHTLLVTFGFGAAYLLLSRRFLERYPLIPFGDLYGPQSGH